MNLGIKDGGMGGSTAEARVLARRPEIRRAVVASGEFAAWRDALPVVEIDGETLYLRGGDMLNDEEQIIVEWARKHGFLGDTAWTEDEDGEP
jgi:hypothetical protein